MKKNNKIKLILSFIAFLIILIIILAILSEIYKPKWRMGRDSAEMRGFYQEEPYSLDHILIGSCNIFSSYSPVLANNRHGIRGYTFASPDQELAVSYYYLKDSLKKQDIKLVVVEALMLYLNPTPKREYYNRLSVDYMPWSLNKANLINVLGKNESDFMRTLDENNPGYLETYLGYYLPVFRYHSRDDLSADDLEYFLDKNRDYSPLKGGFPGYSYLRNNRLDNIEISNGSEMREFSKEYFLKIKELTDKEGIYLLLVNSPNYYRWNEDILNDLENFTKEHNIKYFNFFQPSVIENFMTWDYSDNNGRLNVYGMQKYTHLLSDYLVKNYKLNSKIHSKENQTLWDEAYDNFLNRSKRFNLTPGNIIQKYNEENGIRIRWNKYDDSENYTIWRSEDGENFEEINTVNGDTFLDINVKNTQKYYYSISANHGNSKDLKSDVVTHVFVEPVKNLSVKSDTNSNEISWDTNDSIFKFKIEHKTEGTMNYKKLDIATDNIYEHSKIDNSKVNEYWIRAQYKVDGDTYNSAPAYIRK